MTGQSAPDAGFLVAVRRFPGVSLWLAVALVGLPVSMGWVPGTSWLFDYLFIVGPADLGATTGSAFYSAGQGLLAAMSRGEVWRLITPAFLHFSLLHIICNASAILELGRRLEFRLGTLAFHGVVLVCAVVSHTAQLLYSGQPFFGGLSGIACGMLGMLVVLGWLRPADPVLRLPNGLVAVTLVLLLAMSLGVFEWFGVNVANAAHWGGFVAGLCSGLVAHILLPPAPNLPQGHSLQRPASETHSSPTHSSETKR